MASLNAPRSCDTCLFTGSHAYDDPCVYCGDSKDKWEPKAQPKPEEGGYRYDSGKLPINLVPVEAIHGMAQVLQFGAKKYTARNWEKGMAWNRVYDSAMRHLLDWEKRIDKDPESGLSHLKHALTNLAFLVTYEERGLTKFDDRPHTLTEILSRMG